MNSLQPAIGDRAGWESRLARPTLSPVRRSKDLKRHSDFGILKVQLHEPQRSFPVQKLGAARSRAEGFAEGVDVEAAARVTGWHSDVGAPWTAFLTD